MEMTECGWRMWLCCLIMLYAKPSSVMTLTEDFPVGVGQSASPFSSKFEAEFDASREPGSNSRHVADLFKSMFSNYSTCPQVVGSGPFALPAGQKAESFEFL